jgi:thioredoxin 1
MTTNKKILLIAGGVVAVLALVVMLFVGGILWFTFSAIGKSEAAQTARTFLQQNERLKSDIGEVRDFGFLVMGDINSNNAEGEASLLLKVIGSKKTVNSRVNLTYRNGRKWAVVGAYYTNEDGRVVELVDLHIGETSALYLGKDENVELLDEGNLEDKLLQAKEPVLVTFSGGLDVKTLQFVPGLLKVSQTYSPQVQFYLILVHIRPDLAEQYKVQTTPTLIMFQNGQEQERVVGAPSVEGISDMIEKQLKK